MGSFQNLDVVSPGFFTAMAAQITSQSLESVEELSSLACRCIMPAPLGCRNRFVGGEFQVFTAPLCRASRSRRPRWKRCTLATDNALGESGRARLGEEVFQPGKEKRTCSNWSPRSKTSLHQDIEQLPWIVGGKPRRKALEKNWRFIPQQDWLSGSIGATTSTPGG